MFMIVSPEDSQVYEVRLSGEKEITYFHELISYSSIDLVEAAEWTTNTMYLKTVDRFNEMLINCFITPGRMRFLLIHTWKNKDDAIKNFFCDVYEYYTKVFIYYLLLFA